MRRTQKAVNDLWIAAALAVAVVLPFVAACGDDDDATEDPHADTWVADTETPVADDLTVIDAVIEGVSYRCLYLYADGYHAGGPAMWCERLAPS